MEISNVFKTSNRYNRIAYVALIIAGILHLILKHNLSDAITYFLIALCFDPFDQEIRWESRSFYQKLWLGVHITLVLTLALCIIF